MVLLHVTQSRLDTLYITCWNFGGVQFNLLAFGKRKLDEWID